MGCTTILPDDPPIFEAPESPTPLFKHIKQRQEDQKVYLREHTKADAENFREILQTFLFTSCTDFESSQLPPNLLTKVFARSTFSIIFLGLMLHTERTRLLIGIFGHRLAT